MFLIEKAVALLLAPLGMGLLLGAWVFSRSMALFMVDSLVEYACARGH
ncbi:MAG: hypothetical protein U1D41_14905 [Nitrosomonas sp.]|nr:hypothetical protein [Nitrosomonas sp.]MDP3663205.1 hypothetical protein [Nitrosomonas sp.]MDZ4107418.1 hypothetical protein [Nitrosomonas sp.]